MKEDQAYPRLVSLAKEVEGYLQKNKAPSGYLLEFKYAKLIRSRDHSSYKSILASSADHVIVLNDRFDFSKHRINASASKEEYENARLNCEELHAKKELPPSTITMANVYLENGAYFKYVVDDKSIKEVNKDNIVDQFNILFGKKEFRCAFSKVSIAEKKNAKDLLKSHHELPLKQVRTVRLKSEKMYFMTPDCEVVLSIIYQLDSQHQNFLNFLEDMMAILKQGDKEKLDHFITKNLAHCSNKYQVETRVTEFGNQKMLGLGREGLISYIGQLFMFHYDLSLRYAEDLVEEIRRLSLSE